MIGYQNQFLMRANVNGIDDFVTGENLVKCTVRESVGLRPPTVDMVLKIKEENLLSQLKEGQVIQMSMGKSTDDLKDFQFYVLFQNVTQIDRQNYLIRLSGVTTDPNYFSELSIEGKAPELSIDRLKEVVSRRFTWHGGNTGASPDDEQIWLQTAMTDKDFLFKLWAHSFMEDNMFLPCITRENEFIYKDLIQIVSSGPKTEANQNENSGGIHYDSDFSYTARSGLINEWVGYEFAMLEYDMVEGKKEIPIQTPKSFISLTKQLEQRISQTQQFLGQRYKSRNCHEKYWLAYYKNLQTLANMSANCLKFTYSKQLDDLRPLDMIMFKTTGIGPDTGSAEHLSGLYMIGATTREIMTQEVRTTLECYRETTNDFSAKM